MKEAQEPAPSEELQKAQGAVAEAKRILKATSPLLIDRLLIATNGNEELVHSLMQDITNTAGQAGTLAIALRRERAITYETEHQELHPDSMPISQESVLFGQDGARPIVDVLKTLDERAELVAKGKSPIQLAPKAPKIG